MVIGRINLSSQIALALLLVGLECPDDGGFTAKEMQRHHYRYRGGPFLRRPGLPPFGRSGLLGNVIVGGLGYLIGRQQVQNQFQQRQPQASAQSDQLAQLRLLGQLRESDVLTEEEFQEQKQKILQQS